MNKKEIIEKKILEEANRYRDFVITMGLLTPAESLENGTIKGNAPVIEVDSLVKMVLRNEGSVEAIVSDLMKSIHEFEITYREEDEEDEEDEILLFKPSHIRGKLFWNKPGKWNDEIVFYPKDLKASIGVKFVYLMDGKEIPVTGEFLKRKFGIFGIAKEGIGRGLYKQALDNVKVEWVSMDAALNFAMRENLLSPEDLAKLIAEHESENAIASIALTSDVSGAFALLTDEVRSVLRNVAKESGGKVSIFPMSTSDVMLTNISFDKPEDIISGRFVVSGGNAQLDPLDEAKPLYDTPLVYDLKSDTIWDAAWFPSL